MTDVQGLAPAQLRAWLQDGQELALLDVAEARHYAQGHIVVARHLPLSQLAQLAPALLPRRGVRVVLYSADRDATAASAQVQRAADILHGLGCTQVWALEGGLAAWQAAGGLLIDGYSALLKAFGERVRQHFAVPALSPAALVQRWQQGAPTTVVDVRTLGEHRYSTLPHALSHPGTEWPLRDLKAHAAAAEPGHLWAVTCFSRTRGVIGTATQRVLHGADVPVAWVDDGVMAWAVQGHAEVRDAEGAADILPPLAAAEAQAQAQALVTRYGLAQVDAAELAQWQRAQDRTVQLFDLRPGAVSRPGVQAVAGGQLLMHVENLLAVRHGRVVLLDESHQLRAAITAFWLAQLGECEAFIYTGDADSVAGAVWDVPAPLAQDVEPVTADALVTLLEQQRAQVLDVGPSLDYVKAHIAQARYANAAALPALQQAYAEAAAQGQWLVLTSPDGAQARHTAQALARSLQATGLDATQLRWLDGGIHAWRSQGFPVDATHTAAQLLTPFWDDWGSIMRVPESQRLAAWERYLHWERQVAALIQAEPSLRFRFFDFPAGVGGGAAGASSALPAACAA